MQMKIYLDSVQIGSFSGLVQSPLIPPSAQSILAQFPVRARYFLLSAGNLSRNVTRTILPDNFKDNRRDPNLKYLIRAISP